MPLEINGELPPQPPPIFVERKSRVKVGSWKAKAQRAIYVPLPTPLDSAKWQNSKLKLGYERMTKERADRILSGWQRSRDKEELVGMNGKKCGRDQTRMLSGSGE